MHRPDHVPLRTRSISRADPSSGHQAQMLLRDAGCCDDGSATRCSCSRALAGQLWSEGQKCPAHLKRLQILCSIDSFTIEGILTQRKQVQGGGLPVSTAPARPYILTSTTEEHWPAGSGGAAGCGSCSMLWCPCAYQRTQRRRAADSSRVDAATESIERACATRWGGVHAPHDGVARWGGVHVHA